MSIQHQLIATAHPEFTDAAEKELRHIDRSLARIDTLAPGIILCSVSDATQFMRRIAKEQLIFTRHLAPVQKTIHLTNEERDIGTIATELAALPSFALLERGTRFAVQTRFVQGDKSQGERSYSSGLLNKTLAEAFAEETGAIEAIKKPQIVVSILCTMQASYLGISPVEENLSNWPGGMRHYAQTPEQISRAEFKLLEALEVFGVILPSEGRTLDLGAAPGGWSRLLLAEGLHVVAVDPALLDPRVAKHSRLEHVRGYAENYLEDAIRKQRKFDLIVNDMRMDARDAARLLAEAARCLRTDGIVISVLKLPHATHKIDPVATFKEALRTLSKQYTIVRARQLFHNRQEVTVVAAQPFFKRA